MAGCVIEKKFMCDHQVAELFRERGGKFTTRTKGIITEVFADTGAHIATMEHDNRNCTYTVRMER